MGRTILPRKTADLTDAVINMCPVSEASGSLMAIENAIGVEVDSAALTMQYSTAGSGDPSPSNVRTITPVTDALVYHTGKNMLPNTTPGKKSEVTFVIQDDGTVYFSGTATSLIDNLVTMDLVPGSYYFSGMMGTPASQQGLSYVYRLDARDMSNNYLATLTEPGQKSITLGETKTVRFRVPAVSSGAVITGSYVRPMLRMQAFTDTTFEGYKGGLWTGCKIGELVSAFPNGIGAGTWNLKTGALRITHGYLEALWSAGTSATTYGSYTRKIFRLGAPSKAGSEITSNETFCNVAPFNYSTTSGSLHFYTNTNAQNIGNAAVFLPTGTADNTTIQIVYPLDPVITYTLPTKTLEMFNGNNTIWTNCGSVTVKYRSNPFMLIV